MMSRIKTLVFYWAKYFGTLRGDDIVLAPNMEYSMRYAYERSQISVLGRINMTEWTSWLLCIKYLIAVILLSILIVAKIIGKL